MRLATLLQQASRFAMCSYQTCYIGMPASLHRQRGRGIAEPLFATSGVKLCYKGTTALLQRYVSLATDVWHRLLGRWRQPCYRGTTSPSPVTAFFCYKRCEALLQGHNVLAIEARRRLLRQHLFFSVDKAFLLHAAGGSATRVPWVFRRDIRRNRSLLQYKFFFATTVL